MPAKPLPPLRELPLMTPWYGPKALAQTGLRDFISRVFGSYADQRIMQAAVDYKPPAEIAHRYDYSDPGGPRAIPPAADGAIWVDYVADTGDGFDSTYAVASLLAEPQLPIAGVEQPLPAAQLLLMGGDQAYPYASMTEYQRRLLQPFNLTTWHADKPTTPPRKLFILPGNHDWYDGLASFDELFCTRRDGVSNGLRMGHWECQQHRSYWAIKLPHDWWIWGLDIQLTASVDVGQVQYFHSVSKLLPDDATQAKIILCIATPSWHVGDEAGTAEAYSGNLQRILNLAIDKARVSVILAGDDHHYARYFNKHHRLNLITSGGGGAYLAPTHQLHNQINVPWMSADGNPHVFPFTLNGAPSTDDRAAANPRREPRPEALFPRRSVSQRLSWLVLLFPLWNPTFCFALGILYWLMSWFYTTAAVRLPGSAQGSSMVRIEDVLRRGNGSIEFWDRLYYLFAAGREQPAFAVVALIVLAMLYGFLAGAKKPGIRALEAGLHWTVHMLAMSVLTQVLLRARVGQYFVTDTIARVVIDSAVMIAASGLLAGSIIAVYLFFGCRVFHTHADNGFSSIRIAGYKNFLRMRITKDELTIYPIGLVRVPHRAGWREATIEDVQNGITAGYVPRRPLKPRLIEGPLVIRPDQMVDLQTPPAT